MSEAVVKRLSKVAREFNLSISTIVDFLGRKGLEVEANPNAKITDDMYHHLASEFHVDKVVREESKLTPVPSIKETASLNTPPALEIEEEQAKPEPPAKEEAPAPAPAPVATPPVVEEKNITVIGKIDLEKFSKKVKEVKPEVKETPPIAEVVEEKKIETPPAKAEPELIRANVERLEGPKVINKIELPVERKKANSADKDAKKNPTPSNDGDEKKKRKRIITQGPGRINLEQESKRFDANKRRDPGKPFEAKKEELDEEKIKKEISDTLARLSAKGSKSKTSKYRKQKREAVNQQLEKEERLKEIDKQTLKVTEFVTANQLANMMNVSVNDVIKSCMTLGMFVSINQRLDAEALAILAEEFGYKVEFVSAEIQETISAEDEDKPEQLLPRSPIVTVMGHVDHGKTSLLDYIRKTNVISGEAGGITQHIGAYSVSLSSGKKITFLDTPGHEAFTAMRARGAQVTDVVIIVIAADDSVMPQTREAINHAQAAGVPMIFAFNKIDKPGANTDKIREELSVMNILVEEWGGKFQTQEISAKKGQNIDLLLDKVLLEAELLELKANPSKKAQGVVIESSLDKGRGYVSTLIVQTGTLKIGDVMVAGSNWGRIKAMFNEKGEKVLEAGPSTPASILGLDGAPNAGDKFNVLADEREAKNIASKRQQLIREQGIRSQKHITLDEIGRRLAVGDFKELNVIVKGDVDGSIEALSDSLLKLSTEKIQVNVIHKSVGQISETDVLLASASDAIIIGFQVRPSNNARKIAEKEQIDIRLYSVIYSAIEEVKAAMEGMLAPKIEEKVVCNVEIREVFKITKVGTVAGCYVQDGKLTRKTKVRIIRDGIVVYSGELGSLKRFKDDVKEVTAGYECGLNIHNFNDIQAGDVIEGFEETEVVQKL